MGTKNNPGTYDCYANADPDEPMFILLGRDPIAPALVLEWADRRAHTRGRSPKVDEARACAHAMIKWQDRVALRSNSLAGANLEAGAGLDLDTASRGEAARHDEIPIARRADVNRLTRAEVAISAAAMTVDLIGVEDVRLTRARQHLIEAASLVADFVDGVPAEPRDPMEHIWPSSAPVPLPQTQPTAGAVEPPKGGA